MSQHLRHLLPAMGEERLGGTGKSVRSPIITVFVGPDEEQFSIHEDVLCQSPVFASWLFHPCKESLENKILLPEDSPEHFQYLVEYLLSNDYTSEMEREFETLTQMLEHDPTPTALKETDTERGHRFFVLSTAKSESTPDDVREHSIKQVHAWEFEIAQDHVDVYILADKYNLKSLKELVTRKMYKHIHMDTNPSGWLDLAAIVYPHISEGDDVFRPLTRGWMNSHLMMLMHYRRVKFDSRAIVARYIAQGGMFAEDVSAEWQVVKSLRVTPFLRMEASFDHWRSGL